MLIMDTTVLYDLSYGLYAIGVKDEERNCGCIANTVFQVSNEDLLIALSMSKNNYTNALIEKSKIFSVSILSEDSNPRIIQELGFKSGKNYNKWENLAYDELHDLPILKDDCAGYLICEKINEMDANTHTLFLAKVIDAIPGSSRKPMTYEFYHRILRGAAPKNAPTFQERKKHDQ